MLLGACSWALCIGSEVCDHSAPSLPLASRFSHGEGMARAVIGGRVFWLGSRRCLVRSAAAGSSWLARVAPEIFWSPVLTPCHGALDVAGCRIEHRQSLLRRRRRAHSIRSPLSQPPPPGSPTAAQLHPPRGADSAPVSGTAAPESPDSSTAVISKETSIA
ncbi:MAG: hypothetical protein P8R54_28850 [Myxococcota bacterium]|nr:hypothetical protein [Myxococcota bacterium]